MKVYLTRHYDEYAGWENDKAFSTLEKARDYLRPIVKDFSENYDDEEAKEIIEDFEDCNWVDEFCCIEEIEVE